MTHYDRHIHSRISIIRARISCLKHVLIAMSSVEFDGQSVELLDSRLRGNDSFEVLRK